MDLMYLIRPDKLAFSQDGVLMHLRARLALRPIRVLLHPARSIVGLNCGFLQVRKMTSPSARNGLFRIEDITFVNDRYHSRDRVLSATLLLPLKPSPKRYTQRAEDEKTDEEVAITR